MAYFDGQLKESSVYSPPEPCITRQSYRNLEYRDLQATAMSVDWTGQYVLLAGRRHLALRNLETIDDSEGLMKFHRNSKYEVSAAEWAICDHSKEYCAIATSQLIEVVTWSRGDPTLVHSLRAHTRMVTDIDWHSLEPHLLASCSIDTFTHLWDLRDPRKPVMSLSAVCMSGATQVGFNRVSGNLLATAHDGDLRIWDQRKGSCPIQYITAHLARIHGINWSHRHETHLTTSSQDGTVKYFDINNPRRAEKIITVASPVWRARYTPFGEGLVTVIVSHRGRGENSLLLWNNACQTAPLCSFVGHTDVILDFAWRPNRNDNTADMDLLTWSRDQTFRVWKLDEQLRQMCEPIASDDEPHAVEAGADKVDAQSAAKSTSYSLQHEFSLLNTNIPHIDVEVLDPVKRNAMVRVSANGHVIMLQIMFPIDYPTPSVPPEFVFRQGTSLDEQLSASLMKMMKLAALQRVKKGRTCLEQCLRALVGGLKKATSGGDKAHLRLQSPRLEGALSGALHDACVPFPKTSGARFNSVGILTTFAQSFNTKRISLKHHQTTTPRALSAISGGYLGNVMGSQPILYAHRDPNTSTFYWQDRLRKSSKARGGNSPKIISTTINIYDISRLMFVNKELAENYIIDANNVQEMCRHNREVAQHFGREDLVQCWSLAERVTGMTAYEQDADYDEPACSQSPFAKNVLESMIMHFAEIHDIQTAAMLCCTFGRQCMSTDMSRSSSSSGKSITHSNILNGLRKFKPTRSPYHTIQPMEITTSTSWRSGGAYRPFRSNSWSDSLDDCRVASLDMNRSLLGDTRKHLYDNFKRSYGDMLYRWGLLVARAKVLKFLALPAPAEVCRNGAGVEFITECVKCNKTSDTPFCLACRRALLYCTVCRLPVRGAANACLSCGHGGHTEHLKIWFEKFEECATGCGCHCINESSILIAI